MSDETFSSMTYAKQLIVLVSEVQHQYKNLLRQCNLLQISIHIFGKTPNCAELCQNVLKRPAVPESSWSVCYYLLFSTSCADSALLGRVTYDDGHLVFRLALVSGVCSDSATSRAAHGTVKWNTGSSRSKSNDEPNFDLA